MWDSGAAAAHAVVEFCNAEDWSVSGDVVPGTHVARAPVLDELSGWSKESRVEGQQSMAFDSRLLSFELRGMVVRVNSSVSQVQERTERKMEGWNE